MVSLARHIPQAHASVIAGKWERKKFEGVELNGKTLAILGMGRIGSEFAKRALAFGMRVLAYDPYLSAQRAQTLRVELKETIEAAVSEADFITLHMPLTKETKGMINAERIALMKPTVRIVNCARGGLVDEPALADALRVRPNRRRRPRCLRIRAAGGRPPALRPAQPRRHSAPRRLDRRSPGKRGHRSRQADPRLPPQWRGRQCGQHAEHRPEDDVAGRAVPLVRRIARTPAQPDGSRPAGCPSRQLYREGRRSRHRPDLPCRPQGIP